MRNYAFPAPASPLGNIVRKGMQTMKCPYIQNQVTVEEIAQEFDDNQCCTAVTTTNVKNVELPDCLQADCVAWRNGHCNFKGNA